jgi:hypothetical protein
MEIKRLADKKIIYKVPVVKIDGVKFSSAYDLLEFLYDLDSTRSGFTSISIENSEWRDGLVKLGLVFRNARGSFNKTQKFDDVCDELIKTLENIL